MQTLVVTCDVCGSRIPDADLGIKVDVWTVVRVDGPTEEHYGLAGSVIGGARSAELCERCVAAANEAITSALRGRRRGEEA